MYTIKNRVCLLPNKNYPQPTIHFSFLLKPVLPVNIINLSIVDE